jgi:hypothetical protein
VAAEALTEPRGGSDFFGAMTRAELEGDHFMLNGMKRFVVGAEGADYFLVYCRTNFDPNAHKYSRLSLLIVETGPGVETEYLFGLMGCRGGGTGRLVFRDVKVPKENLVGELHGGALCFPPDDDPGAPDIGCRLPGGLGRPGPGRALHRQTTDLWQGDPQVPGGQLQGRRRHHPAGRGPQPLLHGCPGRGRKLSPTCAAS